jgi:hypothetical protein
MSSSDSHLRRIYRDVCRGYSESQYTGRPVYIKHLTVFDQTDIDLLREKAFDAVRARGVKTEVEKLKWLGDKGLWTRKDEGDLAAQTAYVENLEKTKSRLAIKSQIVQVDGQLSEARNKLAILTDRRTRSLGLTAEHVAEQKVQYEHIRLAFCSDVGLSIPRFVPSDIAAISDEDADRLLYDYITCITQFSPDNLRRIAIAPWFTNQFGLCGDRLETFYGRPIAVLTIYQANLLHYGQYFRSILTQNDLPKDILGNPDKIEDYMLRSRNLKTMVNRAGPGDRVGIVGGTAEDFKAMGVEDGSSKVHADINRGVKSGLEALKTREATIR